ncbi:hypothetical protein ACH5RR_004777 [Cinchona calisaya]|uniref:Uncharacterized protein n=1 Tax=Cinchona calisaya TaxID=153742 RepID=A0ABD3AYZ6_9GENT
MQSLSAIHRCGAGLVGGELQLELEHLLCVEMTRHAMHAVYPILKSKAEDFGVALITVPGPLLFRVQIYRTSPYIWSTTGQSMRDSGHSTFLSQFELLGLGTFDISLSYVAGV